MKSRPNWAMFTGVAASRSGGLVEDCDRKTYPVPS
jgi:hypothetical protein